MIDWFYLQYVHYNKIFWPSGSRYRLYKQFVYVNSYYIIKKSEFECGHEFEWTPKHNLELVKEMLAERPFDFPERFREISAVWKKTHVKFKLESKNKFHIQKIFELWGTAINWDYNVAILKLTNFFLRRHSQQLENFVCLKTCALVK